MDVNRTSGYSGTPLAKKLGLKDGFTLQVFNAPKKYVDFFHDFPSNIVDMGQQTLEAQIDFIHIFAKSREELETHFIKAKPNLKKNGMLWISWPKKSSKIQTELDKSSIMQYGLDNGLVDTKVAAIDGEWSGHKFVYRLKDRK
ncbi:DUF3052 family protein [Pareuzebyella sediminis]|uniref:DUF3052 family protein n=1 Tax=Pareuzebyella sediminis TaxID=2607998 RepID=UPI0011EDD661|nr:DUF3052 family protein [Pareuzebyella sediminis]